MNRNTFMPIAAVSIITTVIAIITQPWAGLDTPDSSFYTSLALFGDQITDRAPFDSYYWTRLGYIAPLHALTTVTGAELGYALYRITLIAITVASIYTILNRFTLDRSTKVSLIYLTSAVSLSSVILSYLANPYLSGFILAATALVIAMAGATPRTTSPAKTTAAMVLAGITVGWAAQVNPAGSILVATMAVATAIFFRQLLRNYIYAAIATAITFFAFIALGTQIFPGLNWWETFNATRGMTLSDFASSTPVWLTDISLLVPLAVLLLAITIWWSDKPNNANRFALVISSVSVTFLLVFSPLMGGIAMEAPMYQSMLWPPAMIATGLLFTNLNTMPPAKQYPLYGVSLLVIIAAGFMQPTLAFTAGAVIALGSLAFAVTARTRFPRNAAITITALTVFLGSAQLLQNSRTDLGLYFLSPYSWAFASNPIEEKITTAIDVQEWLLANTDNTDSILTWVDGRWTEGDRELYVVAAMQLWGENRLTLEPEVDDYARAILERTNPSVIALYGRSQEAIDTMIASLNANNTPTTTPRCRDFTWPEASNTNFPADSGIACLTRLTSQQAR